MKVCIVTHKVLKGDGQGRVNFEIVRAALHFGHEITVVATEIDSSLTKFRNFRWIKINVNYFPSALLKNLVFSLRAGFWLKHHRQEFSILNFNGAICGGSCDVNSVHFVHSAWLESPAHISNSSISAYATYQWIYSFINSYWEKKALQNSPKIVAVSQKVKDELLNLGLEENRIEVILNGVDLEEFYPLDTLDLKKKLEIIGVSADETYALFVGDIRSNRKNLDSVLKAMLTVPNLHLLVAGSVEGSSYPSLVQDLDLTSRVHFMGFRKDISEIMQVCDFFVFPSRYEACTLALLEAMASGLPIITATSAGGSEIVTPDCGFVLDNPEDLDSLSKAMRTLTDNSALRVHMGKNARVVAEQQSWRITARKYLDAFETSCDLIERIS
jgi:glycosyltransferase involved in cell wall biosynthesis